MTDSKAQRTLKTERFGDITLPEDRVIYFQAPIFGFEQSLEYVMLDHSEESPFKWLQSVTEPALAFVVTNPKLFGIPYEFEISDDVADQLSLTQAEDAMVLSIINIPQDNPGEMTANLLGPIIVNQKMRKALQIVLNNTDYSTKTRLIPDEILNQKSSSMASGAGE
jgi:flagellar assembly factor FliW